MPQELDQPSFSPEQLRELAEVAKEYSSWKELIHALRDNIAKGRVVLRYPALELKEYPQGKIRDWLVIILNIFGDIGVKEGSFPDRIERNRLLARMSGAMNCNEALAKKRLITIEHGGYLKELYGCVLFPTELLNVAPGGG
jgi:hypothetical protein